MACFLIPAAEAIVTTIVEKAVKAKERTTANSAPAEAAYDEMPKIAFSTKLSWLNKLLWGGSLLLAFEHLWHGEVVPWFPFLTAMSDPKDKSEMFHEMLTVGVGMAVLVTLVWCGMLIAVALIEKRARRIGGEADGMTIPRA